MKSQAVPSSYLLFVLLFLTFTTSAVANDHIIGKMDGDIPKVSIGSAYFAERVSKFNESNCYVESLLKITSTVNEDKQIVPQTIYSVQSNGGVSAAYNFNYVLPADLDSYADTKVVYKMKLVPNQLLPATRFKGNLSNGEEYDILKNWVFKVEIAYIEADDKTDNKTGDKAEVVPAAKTLKSRSAPYVEKIDNLKEKVDSCIKKRLDAAKSSGGGGGSGSGEPPKKSSPDALLAQIRTTFPEYNGVTYGHANGSVEDDKKLDELIKNLEVNLKSCSLYDPSYSSIFMNKLESPLDVYKTSRKNNEELLKKRNALLKELLANASTDKKTDSSTLQLYALDLNIANDESAIDSIGGSSLFTQDSDSQLAANSSQMIYKERFLDESKKILKELQKKKTEVEKNLNSCKEGYSEAIRISDEACKRIVKIENCDEEGDCVTEEKSSPVVNSCESNEELTKLASNDLSLHIKKVKGTEKLNSKELSNLYIAWQKEILGVSRRVSALVTDSNYDWAKPIVSCVSSDFEKTLAAEGLICKAPPLLAKYDDKIGYVNLQILLIEEINTLLDKSLGYDQQQVTLLLGNRDEKIQSLKKLYKDLQGNDKNKDDEKSKAPLYF